MQLTVSSILALTLEHLALYISITEEQSLGLHRVYIFYLFLKTDFDLDFSFSLFLDFHSYLYFYFCFASQEYFTARFLGQASAFKRDKAKQTSSLYQILD